MAERISMTLLDREEERNFLHEIANPLATATLLVDGLTEEVNNSSPDAIEKTRVINQLNQIARALEKFGDLLKQRRKAILR